MSVQESELLPYLTEAKLPEWERALLDGSLDESYETLPRDEREADLDVTDPKDDARQHYARGARRQDHGTRGNVDKYFYNARKNARMGIWAGDFNHQQMERGSAITDQLYEGEEVLSPEDYWYLPIADQPDTSKSPSHYYSEPYNPEREAVAKQRQRAKEVFDTNLRADELLEALEAGQITEGAALEALIRPTYGDERARLLELLSEHMNSFDYESGSDEFGSLLGAGTLAARKTVDYNPWVDDDAGDWLEGMHIVQPR